MINTIIHDDCLKIMPTIDSNSVDLILCDLPYGTTKCKWDVILPFQELWENYNRIIKDNGCILLFGVEPFSSFLRCSNLNMYRYDWVWNKLKAANYLFMNSQPGKITENISVFYKKQPMYNPQKIVNPAGTSKRHTYKNPSKISKNAKLIMGEGYKNNVEDNFFGKDYEPDKLLPTNILTFSRPHKPLHPTQKPVKLLEYLIKTYTKEGDLVLDNCAGSGSTLVAAKNLNRLYIGIEKEKEYYDIAVNRLNSGLNEYLI